MSTIDERVVSMKFDNAQFEAASKTTLATLDQLNKSLKLENASKGLHDVNAAAGKTNLNPLLSAVQSIESRFHAMSVIAVTALATIAHKAVETGLTIVKSLTIDPLKTGFGEYETNINSIQTILANTQAAAVTLGDVTSALDELNLYADLTIYNFAEMARNIGTFTAAGVALEPAVAAIKGIANLAALSGSNSMQAATAMYQLSQALSTGTVRLIDWNSVVNAGMGGTVFQRALAQTAVVMGTLNESAVTLDGSMKTVKISGDSFRSSLEQGWLTADVLSTTLAQFTGDLTDAELAVMGFNATQIEAIQKQAAVAKAAATEVKTMSQLLGALREGAGSGWAQTWSIIFGNFTEAKELWSGVYNVLDGIIGDSSRARNELLKEWKELGGRDNLFAGIANIFKTFSAVLKPVGEAFSTIFPPVTAKRLAEITENFRKFTETLMPSAKALEAIREVSYAVFAVLRLAGTIVSGLAGVIGHLLGVTMEGSDGFLDFVISVATFIQQVVFAIEAGDDLAQTFGNLGRILEIPLRIIQSIGQAIGMMFDNVDTGTMAEDMVGFAKSLNPLAGLADIATVAWEHLLGILEAVWRFFGPMASKMAEWFREASDAIGGFNFDDLLAAINTGLFAGLVAGLILNVTRVNSVISQMTDVLNGMEHALNAAALLQIAIAIGVIAASAVALSTLDAGQLTRSLAAIAVMFAELTATMYVMSLMGSINVVKMYAMAASFTVLGIAINILALAIRQLGTMDPEEMHRGLISVALVMGILVATARTLPSGAELVGVAVSLTILSTAILILAQSVKQLGGLDWDELAKGLGGVAVLLGSLALFTKFAQANAVGVLGGVGIVLIAAAIKILASAIQDLQGVSWENVGKGMSVIAASLGAITGALLLLSNAAPTAPLSAGAILIVALAIQILGDAIASTSIMSWETFGKGMAVIGGALAIITAALVLLSDAAPTALLSAGAILVVALAIKILADVIAEMGKMEWEQIVKGLVVLAGALGIIVIALNAMTGSIPGALALLVVSGALLVLSSVLKILGSMEWGEIVKGLVALAAVFLIIGAAGYLLTGAIPGMLGLGAALLLIGAGLALAGAGVFLFAAGLTALSVAGAAGAAAVVAILSAVIGLIPALVKQVGIALLILVDILIEGIPKIVELIVNLLIQLIDGLNEVLPKFGELILKLVFIILAVLRESLPELYDAGLDILLGMLQAIRDHMSFIVDVAGEIIEEFLRALGKELPEVVDAGFEMLISFMDGMTKAIDQNSEEMGRAGADLAWAIVKGAVKGLGSFGGQIKSKLMNIVKDSWNAVLDFFGVKSPATEAIWLMEMVGKGMEVGLDRSVAGVSKAMAGVGESAVDSLRDSLTGLSSLMADKIDPNPTITPVFDLSKVEGQAADLWKLMNIKPITVDGSYSAAREAEAILQRNEQIASENEDDGPGDTFNFTQNNTSPKALSTADIYKKTKNQLSTAKGVLPI